MPVLTCSPHKDSGLDEVILWSHLNSQLGSVPVFRLKPLRALVTFSETAVTYLWELVTGSDRHTAFPEKPQSHHSQFSLQTSFCSFALRKMLAAVFFPSPSCRKVSHRLREKTGEAEVSQELCSASSLLSGWAARQLQFIFREPEWWAWMVPVIEGRQTSVPTALALNGLSWSKLFMCVQCRILTVT